ncbi:MAG: hypothetical protein HKN07_06815 [Acidimicrobiia bacterium]|nr:hypothetical protein [Acidimicrobiia bacterium]
MDDRDLQLLRRLRDETVASDAEVMDARRALSSAIHDEISRATSKRRFVLRPALLGSATAIAAIVVAVSLLGQLVSPTTATAALTEIAAVAEARAPLDAAVGEGVYVASTRTNLVQAAAEDVPGATTPVFSFLLPETREVWIRADGSRLLRITLGEPAFFSDSDEQLFTASGLAADFGIGEVETTDFAPAETQIDVAALPVEPGALKLALLAEAGEPEEARDAAGEAADVMRIAAAVLRETTAPAEIRAAVLEVLAALGDEIEIVRNDDDTLEVAVEYQSSGSQLRRELSFDKASSALVAEQVILVDGDDELGLPAGTMLVDSTFSVPTLAPLP